MEWILATSDSPQISSIQFPASGDQLISSPSSQPSNAPSSRPLCLSDVVWSWFYRPNPLFFGSKMTKHHPFIKVPRIWTSAPPHPRGTSERFLVISVSEDTTLDETRWLPPNWGQIWWHWLRYRDSSNRRLTWTNSNWKIGLLRILMSCCVKPVVSSWLANKPVSN